MLDDDPIPVPRLLAKRLVSGWGASARETAAALGFDTRPLERQVASQCNREGCPGQSPDYYAEPTSFCFGEVFAHTAVLSRRPQNSAGLRRVGNAFGRLVYVLDAVTDFGDDLRSNRFNPFQAVADSPTAAREAAKTFVAATQMTLEEELSSIQFSDPELLRPVLVDALRQIGQRRLGSCASEQSPSEDEPASTESPRSPSKNRRQFLSNWCKLTGGVGGLICGGCCGQCCVECNRKQNQGCKTDCSGCNCRCPR
ncbi:MAG: DUF5685 family protein [Gemmataceae bacterium]